MRAEYLLRLRQIARGLGAPGLFGLFALLLATGLFFMGQRERAEAAQLRVRSEALQAQRQRAGDTPAQAAPVTQAQWQQNLPPATERQQRLADLLEISLRMGLNGARTEHRLSVDPVSGLERLRVNMPLIGSYAQLRQFIGAALAHDPALSLDSLKLRRGTPQAAEVEAELVWSLHSRMETPR